MKSPWTSLVKRNVLRGVTVQGAWHSQRIINVFPIHNVPVLSMEIIINLEL